jgi:uncharacterized protein
VPTPNVQAGELETADLDDWGLLEPPLAIPLDGDMATHGLDLYATEDGSISTGVWQCGPGNSRWDMPDEGEFIHVLSGRMTCTADDGTVTEVGPGATVVFPKGWAGTWNIHETLRKVYVIFK